MVDLDTHESIILSMAGRVGSFNLKIKNPFCTSSKFRISAKYSHSVKGKPEIKANKYTNTVLLPHTKFPARLDSQKRVSLDKFLLEKCGFPSLYLWQRENAKGDEFILHDGPPYANGKPHMGHAINKVLKDITIRHKLLQGHRIHYVAGWDCHGLPIELKAVGGEQESRLSAVEIRSKAREFAKEAISYQRSVFSSWGVMANWEESYCTFNSDYIKNQLRQFFSMYEKGIIYRDLKPVFWSPSSRTALAEAELEYNSSHRSTAVFVRLPLTLLPSAVLPHVAHDTRVFALVWTTTPWTLPANQAVCYNPALSYSLVTLEGEQSCQYVMAKDLVQQLQKTLGRNVTVVTTFSGAELGTSCRYRHPVFPERQHPLLPAQHVTADQGSGLVHTAPAHGADDFLVALQHGISVDCLVDEDGRYTDKAGPVLVGHSVLDSGEKVVLELMEDDIIHTQDYVHSYPYDWRTRQPVILRASHQWFINTELVKNQAVDCLRKVRVVPDRNMTGMLTQLERRPYWCISRQRVWGVPIPVLYDSQDCPLISRTFVDHLCSLLDSHGPDFWWQLSAERLVSKDLLTTHSLSAADVRRGEDILDIWFDSGVSWSCVLPGQRVADLYLEGHDQFTGWFQSSLMTSVALRQKAPYRTLFVHGFAVDGEGRKMSKSVGNVVDPELVVRGGSDLKKDPAYGVDTLRWWVASHGTQHTHVPVSSALLRDSADSVQKLRRVLRFLLGALHNVGHDTQPAPGHLYILDQYLLHLLWEYEQQITDMYDNYQYNRVCAAVLNFVTNEVSALYCHLIKDRLYCERRGSTARGACQTVLQHILEVVTCSIAPVLPFLAEEVYLYHPCPPGEEGLFRSGVVKAPSLWNQPQIVSHMLQVLDVRRALNKAAGDVSTWETEVTIRVSSEDIFRTLQLFQQHERSSDSQLTEILQVSSAHVLYEKTDEHANSFQLHVSPTHKPVCGRCRRFSVEYKEELCLRCQNIVAQP